jgi:hypothetical protein
MFFMFLAPTQSIQPARGVYAASRFDYRNADKSLEAALLRKLKRHKCRAPQTG